MRLDPGNGLALFSSASCRICFTGRDALGHVRCVTRSSTGVADERGRPFIASLRRARGHYTKCV